MSKRNLFWGKGSGKLGELVLYRAGGVQRARTYVSEIKNPKSPLQMAQRVKMANVCGFFRSARPFLEKSFTNRPVRQSGFNALATRVLRQSDAAISRDLADEGFSVPFNFPISSGSCPISAPTLANVVSHGDDAAEHRGLNFGGASSESFYSGDLNSHDYIAPAFQHLIDNYPDTWGALPKVFHFNIIIAEYHDDGFKTYLRQIRVDWSSGRAVTSGDVSPTLYGIHPFGTVTDSSAQGKRFFCVGFSRSSDGNGAYFAGAFISYTDGNGKLVANNASMVVVHDSNNYINQFRPKGEVYEQYLSDLGVNAPNILATR